MKRIKLILILILVIFFVTGCGLTDNNSSENVALAMVKRLSKDNYKNIGNLFYQSEGTYFDDEVFKELIESKKLNISGNKKIEVIEVGSEITNADGYVQAEVKIAIDDDRTFNLDTIEVDGKWYVYDESFYDKGLIIVVPDGADVKINNKKVDSDYYKKTALEMILKHPSSTSKTLSAVGKEVNAYSFDKVLKGNYDITVDGDKTIKDVIYSYSNSYNISSINYTYELQNSKIVYNIGQENNKDDLYAASAELKSSIETYLKDFYGNFISTFSKTVSIDTMSKYFEKNSSVFDTLKQEYKSSEFNIYGKDTPYKSSYTDFYYYYSDVKLNSLKIEKVYYSDDSNILVAFDLRTGYKYYSDSYTKGSDREAKTLGLVSLKKTADSFVITSENTIF